MKIDGVVKFSKMEYTIGRFWKYSTKGVNDQLNPNR